jgi:transcriptional regulator with XRE-family HTH domain
MIPAQLNDAMRKLSANAVENLKYAMESQGLSWSSLSHSAGLSTSTIYPIKNGRTNVGTASACQLGVALGLGIEEVPKLFLPHSEFVDFYSPRADANTKVFVDNANEAMAFHEMKWKDISDQWEFEAGLWKSISAGKTPLDADVASKIARALFIEGHELENMFKPKDEFSEWYMGKMKPLSDNLSDNVMYMIEQNSSTWASFVKDSTVEKSVLLKIKSKDATAGLGLATLIAKTLGISDIGSSVLYFEHGRFIRAISTRLEN